MHDLSFRELCLFFAIQAILGGLAALGSYFAQFSSGIVCLAGWAMAIFFGGYSILLYCLLLIDIPYRARVES
jgi:hypothetical protein